MPEYVCVCVCVCVWVCALSRVTPHPPHTFYSLTQDSKEKRRAEKRREERSRDERCWHKMLTCQHWLRERDMGRGNRGSDRRWQNEQITMTKGFDWNWRATGRRGILEDGSGSKVGGGGDGGRRDGTDAGWGASHDLYVTQLQAHFLSVSVCLPFTIVSLRSLSHLQREGTRLMVSKLKRLSVGAFSVPSLNLSGGDECTPTPPLVTTQLCTADAIKILI